MSRLGPLPVRTPPAPGESLLGLLVRLAGLNHYPSPSWLGHVIDQSFLSLATQDAKIADLAILLGLSEDEVRRLGYMPLSEPLTADTMHDFCGQPVKRRFLRLKSRRYCSACLAEGKSHQVLWDLVAVTVCPVHAVNLRETCPKCREPTTFDTADLCTCRSCGYDLRVARHTSRVDPHALAVSRLMARIVGMSDANEAGRFAPEIETLPLNEAIRLFLLIAAQMRGRSWSTGDTVADDLSMIQLANLLARSGEILSDWPTNFRAYLASSRRANVKPTNLMTKFGPLYSVIFQQLPGAQLDFLRDEFNRFVAENWSGHVNHRNTLVPTAKQKFMTFAEAAQATGLGEHRLRHAIEVGDIRAEESVSGNRTFTMIDPASVEAFMAASADLIGLTDVIFQLHVKPQVIKALGEAGVIAIHRKYGDGGATTWQFRRKTVDQLLESILGHLSPAQGQGAVSVLSFHGVCALCGRSGIKLPTLIAAMVNGEVRPIGIDETRKGLQTFQFDHAQVQAWCQAHCPHPRQGMTIYQAATALNLKHDVVAPLIKAGMIRHLAEPVTGLQTVDPVSVHSFYDTYVASAKVATGLGISPTKLVELLASKGVKPVSGPSVDGGRLYVYRRADLDGIDLVALVRDGSGRKRGTNGG